MRSQKFLFYYFQSIVPLHFCDDIVKFAASKNSKEGDIFGTDQSMANFTVFKKRLTKLILSLLLIISLYSIYYLDQYNSAFLYYIIMRFARNKNIFNFKFVCLL